MVLAINESITVSDLPRSTSYAQVAVSQSVTTGENTARTITLSATDEDGDSLTYIIVSSPAHGSLSGTGAVVTYVPNSGYTGNDSFTFKANDGVLDSNTATVSIYIQPVYSTPGGGSDTLVALSGLTSASGVTLDSYGFSRGAGHLTTPDGRVTLDIPAGTGLRAPTVIPCLIWRLSPWSRLQSRLRVTQLSWPMNLDRREPPSDRP